MTARQEFLKRLRDLAEEMRSLAAEIRDLTAAEAERVIDEEEERNREIYRDIYQIEFLHSLRAEYSCLMTALYSSYPELEAYLKDLAWDVDRVICPFSEGEVDMNLMRMNINEKLFSILFMQKDYIKPEGAESGFGFEFEDGRGLKWHLRINRVHEMTGDGGFVIM